MKRNFNEINDNELNDLKQTKYAKSTKYGINTVKGIFRQYLQSNIFDLEQESL